MGVEAVVGPLPKGWPAGILINNGDTSYLASLLYGKEKTWDSIFDVNRKGARLRSRAVAQRMMARSRMRTIKATEAGAGRGGAYQGSKIAPKMLTMPIAVEWVPDNIDVSAVELGSTQRVLSGPVWDDAMRAQEYLSAVPQGRVAEPD